MLSEATTPPTAGLVVDLDALADGCALDRFLRVGARLRAAGTAIIATSDARRSDVIYMYPGIRADVDALIYEHGCVAEVGGRLFPLARPVPQFVGEALRRSGIPAVSGQVAILVPPRAADAAQSLYGECAETGVAVTTGPLGAVVAPASTSPCAALTFVAARLGLERGCIDEARTAADLRAAAGGARAHGAHRSAG